MHQEGAMLRAAGLHSLTGDLAAIAGGSTGALQEGVVDPRSPDLIEASLLADQNMAALLEEEESAQDLAKEGGKKKKKKKRSKKAFDAEVTVHEDGQEDGEEDAGVHEGGGGEVGSNAQGGMDALSSATPSTATTRAHPNGTAAAPAAGSPAGVAGGDHHGGGGGASAANPERQQQQPTLTHEEEEHSEQEEARRVLDEVTSTAAEMCKADGGEGGLPAVGIETLQRTLKQLDGAIDRACALTVR